MPALLVVRPGPCAPDRFLRLAAGLLAHEGPDPLLLAAPLAGEALWLGRHQRAASALHLDAARAAGLPAGRRLGGGRTLHVGAGTVALLAVAPPGAALFPGPFAVDKVMNRYVRGLLAGLRPAGARQAAWFGRDAVSSGGARVALVSQEGTAEGATALEAVIAVARDLALPAGLGAYPAHADPRAGGPPPATLEALAGGAVDPEAVIDAVVRGYATAAGLPWRALDGPPPEGAAPPPEAPEDGLGRSGPVEIAIGFAEALARVEAGRLAEVRLRGDFIAPLFAVRALEASLVGCPPTFAEVGARVDAAFRLPGACVHGVAALGPLAAAVVAAAAAAPGRG